MPQIEVAGSLVPEEEAHVRILAPADMHGAQLVMQFKDNGRNQLWWQHIGTVDADQMDFAVAPPAESAADMVTLRVAILDDLRLSYLSVASTVPGAPMKTEALGCNSA